MRVNKRPLRKNGSCRRWAAMPLAVAGLALLAASCGGGGGSSGAYGSPGTTAKATASAATISVRKTALGSILTDGRGETLYLFEKDTGTSSTCYGPCAAAWPPLTTAAAQPDVAGGADQTLLGTTTRTDGTMQTTYAGHPLYYFTGDQKPGDTMGQGLQNFGGGWDVLTPGGMKIEGGAK